MSEVEKNRDVKRNNGSCRYFNVLISCEFRQLFRKVHLRWFPTLWIRTFTNCRGMNRNHQELLNILVILYISLNPFKFTHVIDIHVAFKTDAG